MNNKKVSDVSIKKVAIFMTNNEQKKEHQFFGNPFLKTTLFLSGKKKCSLMVSLIIEEVNEREISDFEKWVLSFSKDFKIVRQVLLVALVKILKFVDLF
jgi:hypothetical protein